MLNDLKNSKDLKQIDGLWVNISLLFSNPLHFLSLLGNAFVACGVVYMIDSYSGRTKINRAYDTKTGRSWNPNIVFEWQYNYGSSLDYNPKEKMLYAWDNHYQVTYFLTLGKRT